MSPVVRVRDKWKEEEFAAAMTNRQFLALRTRLEKHAFLAELRSLPALRRISKTDSYNRQVVQALLSNGWNTEQILRMTRSLLDGDQLLYALQWAFPQAYYSCYAVMMAFFRTVGHTENNHATAIKRFGLLAEQGHYPTRLSFLALGGKKITFEGIRKHPSPSAMHLDVTDERSVDTQICQFLKGTRERDLKARRERMKFRNAEGKVKQRLTAADWNAVAKGLGPTSIISLLYRKRIKANYREIDTFLSEVIEPEVLYDNLAHIVACINFTHESFIFGAVGDREYSELLANAPGEKYPFLQLRAKSIREIVPQGTTA